MCFSATASFTASAALGGIGAASLATARTPAERTIATIPLIFALQQFCEGIVWLSMGSPFVSELASSLFLLAAFGLWPFLISWSFWRMETSIVYQQRLKWLVWLGAGTSIYGLYVVTMLPTYTSIVCSSIRYDVSAFLPWGGVAYVMATVLPGLLSSSRTLRLFGMTLFLCLVAAWMFWMQTTYSVWCFFGALLSSLIYLYLRERRTSVLPSASL